MNSFLSAVRSKDTTTDNGAISNSSTGSTLADQFGVAGAQRGRSIEAVFADQSKLHNTYGIWALRFVFYLRLITRKIKMEDTVTESVQKGQGNRDESFKRLLWYAVNQPDLFYKNLWLLAYVGCYKDYFDLIYIAKTNKLDVDMYLIMVAAIQQKGDLFLKYLPIPVAKSKVKTPRADIRNQIGKMMSAQLELSYVEMRKLKSGGKAHEWQKLISKQLFDKIEFNKISGKALLNLVTSKFLKNQGLEDTYEKWIEKQPIAKFTGYPHELGMKVKVTNKKHVSMTLDKQFEGLLQLGRSGGLGNRKVICAMDTSSSMLDIAIDKVSCMDVCMGLGVYFSSLMEGVFKNWVIRFTSKSDWTQLNGTFSDKILQARNLNCWPSNTNFQSIIDSFVRVIMDRPDIDELEFPDTLLIVSDMQFDSAGLKTNYEMAIDKLSKAFSKDYVKRFMFIWWQVNGTKKDYPQTINEPGGYVVSGFDGAIVSVILGGEEKLKSEGKELSMDEMIKEALSQEILLKVE